MIIAQFKYFARTDFHRNEPNEPFLFLCTNDSPGRFSQAGSACCITSQNNTKYHHNWSWTKNASWAGLDLVGKKNSAVLFYQLLRSTTNHKEWRHKWWSSKIGIFDPGFYFEFVWEQLSPKFVKYWPKFHNHPGLKVWDDYQMYSIKLSEVLPSSQNSELDISAPLTNSAPNAQIIQKTTFAWIGWDK